jgi:uncharacterized protein (TIGR02246 family)
LKPLLGAVARALVESFARFLIAKGVCTMRAHRLWVKVVSAAIALGIVTGGVWMGGRAAATDGPDEKVGHPPARIDPRTAADEESLRRNGAAYAKAFSTGDAKGLAAFWTEDGDFVDTTGRLVRGRAAIEKDLAALFAQSGGLTLVITPESFQFLSPDVVIETGLARVTKVADGSASASRYTVVHVKRDGRWLLSSVRETPYEPPSNYEYLKELEWLIGKWVAKGNNATLEQTCEWTGHKNFITRTYTVKGSDGLTHTGLQVIGWDPMARRLRSWTFDSEGSFQNEWWARDGNRWVVSVTGVLRDGSQTQSGNVIKRVDDDTFTWRAGQRRIAGVSAPDLGEVKITRVKAKK